MRNSRSFREEAWGILSQNYWTMFLLFLFYILATGAVEIIINTKETTMIPEILGIGALAILLRLLTLPLQFGYYWCVLDFSRQKDVSIKDIVEPYMSLHMFLKTIAVSFVMGILLLLWTLLLIIPGIIKSFSYAMVPYILKDNPDIGIIDAITKSRQIMDGNKWRLFKLFLSFIGWGILIILTFGLAVFWVGPYIDVAKACFYNEVSRKYEEMKIFHQDF